MTSNNDKLKRPALDTIRGSGTTSKRQRRGGAFSGRAPVPTDFLYLDDNTTGGHSGQSTVALHALPPNIRPFPVNIGTLPKQVLKHILSYLLHRSDSVRPFYHTGVLLNGLRTTSIRSDEDLTREALARPDNIDLSTMLVNKAFNEAAREVYYQGNRFLFNNPDLCQWFIKRIGTQNLSSIRSLTLRLQTGWSISANHRQPFDKSHEETWFQNLCFLQNRHQLDKFTVVLHGWTDLTHASVRNTAGYDIEEAEELTRWRTQIIRKLAAYRGVDSPKILQLGCSCLSSGEVNHIHLLMKRGKEQQQPPKEKIGLDELIRRCRNGEFKW